MGITFQIVLCGGFFALCLSDVLDISANFSAVRFFLNIFYALTFLSLTAFALSDLQQKKQKHIQMIVSFCAALIAVQCFIFPYDAANEFIRICKAVEGIAVFALLIILVQLPCSTPRCQWLPSQRIYRSLTYR